MEIMRLNRSNKVQEILVGNFNIQYLGVRHELQTTPTIKVTRTLLQQDAEKLVDVNVDNRLGKHLVFYKKGL